MAGITANVQRTGEPDADIVSYFTRAGIAASGCLLRSLYARKDGCVTTFFNSLENAVPLYVCLQDKGEGCLACFTELANSVKSGFQGILGDPKIPNSHLLPCYLSSLRTLWKMFGIP